jgi:glucose-1-phosphatase
VDIKNIIFDLGGVIINLEPGKPAIEFAKSCGLSEQEILNAIQNNIQLFLDYEIGKIDSVNFRKQVAGIINHDICDEDFDLAWNSILFDVPESRMSLLERLKGKYRLFLFSNTNDLHVKRLDEILSKSPVTSKLLGIFEKVYYSHQISMRKPNIESFLHIIDENNLSPSETLFIDDTLENIEGAKKVGLQVLHVERNNPQLDFLL